jgi:hypothetical protein
MGRCRNMALLGSTRFGILCAPIRFPKTLPGKASLKLDRFFAAVADRALSSFIECCRLRQPDLLKE